VALRRTSGGAPRRAATTSAEPAIGRRPPQPAPDSRLVGIGFMAQYLARRFLLGLVTLVAATFVVYLLIRAMPGDPALMQMPTDPRYRFDPKQYEQLRRQLYLDQRAPVAYVMWLKDVARGDLGTSFSERGRRVSERIAERVGPTLLLTCTSLFLAYLLSIPLGLWCTVRNGLLRERVVSTGLYMLYSLPAFVAALMLQIFFALKLEGTIFELPLRKMTSPDFDQLSFLGKAVDLFRHALLPIACFTYGSLAYYTRFIKANMMEVIRQDYIRTARAKGVPPVRIVVHHAFRNTLIPLVTQIGLTLPALLSGAVILEKIFSWPGMGSLLFESLQMRDYPTLMGLMLMFSVLTLLGQLLADVLYAFVDPRVRLS
jgi:peptide/nickel transport system permease protein